MTGAPLLISIFVLQRKLISQNLSVAIDNWSRFPLIDPQTDLECGRHIGALPEVIVPGTSEMALFEKGVIVNIKRQNILQAVPLKLDFCKNQTK